MLSLFKNKFKNNTLLKSSNTRQGSASERDTTEGIVEGHVHYSLTRTPVTPTMSQRREAAVLQSD